MAKYAILCRDKILFGVAVAFIVHNVGIQHTLKHAAVFLRQKGLVSFFIRFHSENQDAVIFIRIFIHGSQQHIMGGIKGKILKNFEGDIIPLIIGEDNNIFISIHGRSSLTGTPLLL